MTEWIEWDGSSGGHPDLPLDTIVEVKFRDGMVLGSETVGYWYGESEGLNNWLHRPELSEAEIIAYRVAK